MLLVLFSYAVGITLSLPNAVYASCFFIWSDIFRPSDWARRYGLLATSFYPVHIVTAVLAFSILFRPWKRRWNMGATVLLVSLGWFLICALAAEYSKVAMDKTITTFKYFIPLAFISATLCTRHAQRLFLYTLAGSVGIWLAHHGLLGLLRGSPVIDMSIPGGQMSDRNDFLVAGTACVPMMLYAGFHYHWRWQKWVRPAILCGAGLAVLAAVFSLSRGAIVGFTALLIWYSFLTGRFFRRIAVGGLIAIAAVIFMPEFVWSRLATIETGEIEYQTEGSARNRVEHMLTAVKVTLDHPLTGVGADNFPRVSLRYSTFDAEPHSLWLKCSAEYGLPMLVFFTLVVILLLVRLRRRARLARTLGDRDGEAMATALSCALFGFLATGTFTSQFLSEYMWAIIGLIGAFLATPLDTPLPPPPPEEPVPSTVARQKAA
jgi:O-antigen ligase